MKSSSNDRDNTLYVLYGSQMGNSEQAAKDFVQQFRGKQNQYDAFQGLQPKAIQLDDYLEMYHSPVSALPLIIFVSSYGVGQAPLGANRFREVCDTLIENDQNNKVGNSTLLKGMSYAICGLGDSSYPTYLKNPATIDQGLTVAGATRIVGTKLGKADASQSGTNSQDKVIQEWIQNLWEPLSTCLQQIRKQEQQQQENDDENNDNKVDYKLMQQNIIKMLIELDPDYTPPKGFHNKGSGGGTSSAGCGGGMLLFLAIAVGIVAIGIKMGIYDKLQEDGDDVASLS